MLPTATLHTVPLVSFVSWEARVAKGTSVLSSQVLILTLRELITLLGDHSPQADIYLSYLTFTDCTWCCNVLITVFLLPTTYYLLLTTYYLLPTSCYAKMEKIKTVLYLTLYLPS